MDKRKELFTDIYMQGVMDAMSVIGQEAFDRDKVLCEIGTSYMAGKIMDAYKKLIGPEDDDEG